jgi:hypothetical protein
MTTSAADEPLLPAMARANRLAAAAVTSWRAFAIVQSQAGSIGRSPGRSIEPCLDHHIFRSDDIEIEAIAPWPPWCRAAGLCQRAGLMRRRPGPRGCPIGSAPTPARLRRSAACRGCGVRQRQGRCDQSLPLRAAGQSHLCRDGGALRHRGAADAASSAATRPKLSWRCLWSSAGFWRGCANASSTASPNSMRRLPSCSGGSMRAHRINLTSHSLRRSPSQLRIDGQQVPEIIRQRGTRAPGPGDIISECPGEFVGIRR